MARWTVELVDDLEAPGWLPVPEGLTPPERDQWVADTSGLLEELVGTPRWDGEKTTIAARISPASRELPGPVQPAE